MFSRNFSLSEDFREAAKSFNGQPFTKEELKSRCEIMLENYVKTVTIEANTMIDMAKTQILPAVCRYCADSTKNILAKKELDMPISLGYEKKLVAKLSAIAATIDSDIEGLEEAMLKLTGAKDIISESLIIRDFVLDKMCRLRVACDEAETLTSKEYWPYPSYGDILFSVK